jgi:hypothetical protein
MTILQILIDARALISDEARWTKGTASKFTVEGRDEPDCWCWLGAVWHVQNNKIDRSVDVERVMTLVARQRGYGNLVMLNDDPATTHADVLAAFDAAIERAKSA